MAEPIYGNNYDMNYSKYRIFSKVLAHNLIFYYCLILTVFSALIQAGPSNRRGSNQIKIEPNSSQQREQVLFTRCNSSGSLANSNASTQNTGTLIIYTLFHF